MNNIKTLTMYLPQFHRTADNDTWWGEGFTEWTAVRAAKPLFAGHKQPRIPLHEFYYDLLEKETMYKQAEWMNQYGVDGQCFYHYYFESGRMTLEKPAENLLEWTDINMPFCFCWANTTWSRTWSNISGNTWADEFEKSSGREEGNGILISQKYGREKDWKKHFEYLLPFFKDERYIKVDGRPVFMITWIDAIPCLQQMVEYWRILAADARIKEVFFIGMGVRNPVPNMDALLIGGPHSFWNLGETSDGIFRIKYDDIWEKTLAAEPIEECKTYIGGFVDYDDTCRRGKHGGIVAEGFTIDKFYHGMKELYKKNMSLKNEFVFINAWNEWGEGMYLEPDTQNGLAVLEALQRAKNDAIEELKESKCTYVAGKRSVHSDTGNTRRVFNKAVRCFSDWMTLRENDKCLADYLLRNNMKNVAVYGYGALGKHLVTELDNSEISVKYLIDRNVRLNHLKYEIKRPEDRLPEVDAIIVTPMDEFEKIYLELKKHTKSRIVSLLELTSELI